MLEHKLFPTIEFKSNPRLAYGAMSTRGTDFLDEWLSENIPETSGPMSSRSTISPTG